MCQYKSLLRMFLRDTLYSYRKDHGLSQEQMAELLHISPRSYIDQEHGRYSFSAPTMMFFILALSDEEKLALIHGFKEYMEKAEERGDVM
ncbi:helix-turn-helix domain-containing protein [Oscillibacter sp. MSJ-2]|uniref:Helix-turn-helix domain-containing protein n=1 Tax=Dysosmobacter acutus TaxID=2841504 RepID=A0ABS6FBN6_9FIRM|nr:helix-turn-helix transcriptional regulator [Dysosmobacter acutus]MBU5627690.1 helix-turn-helix domain-containing protein [Dysosmobacter acutus]